MYDIAIIGAGPAGSTLARLIGDKYKVLLVDKRRLKSSPKNPLSGKCCGGLLAPDAQRMLSKLGLGLPINVLEEPQVFVVRAIDIQQKLEGYYQRHYINMNRQKFDHWLLSIVPSNVDIKLDHRLKSYTFENNCFCLDFLHKNKIYSEKAKILVGADGASSKIRAQSFPKGFSPKRYFAIQEWVQTDNSLPYFSSFFDRDITDYYCWTIPKGDHTIIGAALLPKNNILEKFKLLKSKLKDSGFQFGKTYWKEGTYVLRPLKQEHIISGTKGIALLGEAAGFISPSSAEGISYALRSAMMLAESLRPSLNGFEKRYHQKAKALKKNLFAKKFKSYLIFNPMLRKLIMKSGLQNIRVYKP